MDGSGGANDRLIGQREKSKAQQTKEKEGPSALPKFILKIIPHQIAERFLMKFINQANQLRNCSLVSPYTVPIMQQHQSISICIHTMCVTFLRPTSTLAFCYSLQGTYSTGRNRCRPIAISGRKHRKPQGHYQLMPYAPFSYFTLYAPLNKE
jgi:hypothetical protein